MHNKNQTKHTHAGCLICGLSAGPFPQFDAHTHFLFNSQIPVVLPLIQSGRESTYLQTHNNPSIYDLIF